MAEYQTLSEDSCPDILHVLNTATQGGGASHVLGLLTHQHRCSQVLVGERGWLDQQCAKRGITCHHVSFMQKTRNPLWFHSLARALQKIHPKLVHLHGTRAAFLYALAVKFGYLLPPAIYTNHGLSFRQNFGSFRKWLHTEVEHIACKSTKHTVVVSQSDYRELQTKNWHRNNNLHFIPNAVDVQQLKQSSVADRKEFGIPSSAPIILIACRLVAQKDPLTAVQTVLKVMRTHEQVHCLIAGDGPLREKVQELIRKSPFTNRFSLLGTRNDIPSLLSLADIYLLTSLWEGLPIGILEAMACSCAIVASATEGTTDIITHEEHGLLSPPGDAKTHAYHCVSFINNKELSKTCRKAALELVKSEYSMEKQQLRITEIYGLVNKNIFRNVASGASETRE